MAKKPLLSQKDLKLWQKVADTVTPMEGKSAELKALIEHMDQPSVVDPINQPDPDHPVQHRRASEDDMLNLKKGGMGGDGKSRSQPLPSLSPIDRKEKKRIVRGRAFIDSRIDLHGMTQREAHSALFGFLRSAHSQGHKHVLVITGKGSRGDTETYSVGPEKGVLRRVVPKWLSEPEIRALIVGFEEAHRTLGGAGALHVRLRKRGKSG